MTKESYLEKAEKFIKIDDLTGNTIMETLARGIKMFAKWLDDQQKECGATYGHGSSINLQTGKCICGKPYSDYQEKRIINDNPPIGSTINPDVIKGQENKSRKKNMTYLEKAEKFIEEIENHQDFKSSWEKHKDFLNIISIIKDFARYLDSQEKSEGKERIERLKGSDIEYKMWSDTIDKINEIIDFLNAEK